MSLRSYIQDHPTPLVWAWEATAWALRGVRPLLAKLGLERASKLVKLPEELVKGALFNCQDCAQCVLHYSGMTCPMTCPKQLRNGPCGGVRLNGKCEVKPETACVWVQAVARSQKTPYAQEILRLNPPVDWRLAGQASWVTYALGRDQVPTGSDVQVRYATEALPPGTRVVLQAEVTP
jgi:hypothetical protein